MSHRHPTKSTTARRNIDVNPPRAKRPASHGDGASKRRATVGKRGSAAGKRGAKDVKRGARRTLRRLVGLAACGLVALIGLRVVQPTQAQAEMVIDRSEVNVVVKSFLATGATADNAVVHDYTVMNHAYLNAAQLAEIGTRWKQDLAICGAKIIRRNDAGERLWEVYGTRDGHTVVTVVVSTFAASGQPAESVLTISEQLGAPDLGQLNADVTQLGTVLQQDGCVPEISTCVTGFLGARLGNVSPETLVDSAFRAVAAKVVEGESTPLVTGVSGYTRETPWHLDTAGGEMNVQVGVHYDSVRGQTKVVVGSPIIVIAY